MKDRALAEAIIGAQLSCLKEKLTKDASGTDQEWIDRLMGVAIYTPATITELAYEYEHFKDNLTEKTTIASDSYLLLLRAQTELFKDDNDFDIGMFTLSLKLSFLGIAAKGEQFTYQKRGGSKKHADLTRQMIYTITNDTMKKRSLTEFPTARRLFGYLVDQVQIGNIFIDRIDRDSHIIFYIIEGEFSQREMSFKTFQKHYGWVKNNFYN